VIENIEGLASKLQSHVLAEPDVLDQREINPLRRWTIDDAAPGITGNIGYAAGRSRRV
jgi:hypothetical protein